MRPRPAEMGEGENNFTALNWKIQVKYNCNLYAQPQTFFTFFTLESLQKSNKCCVSKESEELVIITAIQQGWIHKQINRGRLMKYEAFNKLEQSNK